ncbi:MAG: flagellar biosynthetic protein FliR [Verrucomicrobiota bacterium]|nr:flagellar biosynthetic protein FliR [Verrucomicrobiota bacterium]
MARWLLCRWTRKNLLIAVFDVTTWFLVFARVTALFAVFPLFSGQNVPVILRLSLAVLVAILVTPFVPGMSGTAANFVEVFKVLFAEVSAGLLLGFACRFLFFALEFAAGIISTEMGLTMSSNFNSLNSSVMMTPGLILYWLAIMLLLCLDMHHWMLAGFRDSYSVLPIGGASMSKELLTDIILRSSKVFLLAIQLTAPVLACSFIITLVFSLLGRAVPQMNVFAESFPVKSLAGMIVFGLTCTLSAQHMINWLRRLPTDFMQIAQLLGAK